MTTTTTGAPGAAPATTTDAPPPAAPPPPGPTPAGWTACGKSRWERVEADGTWVLRRDGNGWAVDAPAGGAPATPPDPPAAGGMHWGGLAVRP